MKNCSLAGFGLGPGPVVLFLGTGITSFFCPGAGVSLSWISLGLILFAVVSSIKPGTLKNNAGTATDEPLDLLIAFRTLIQRLSGDILEGLKSMSAMRALVFVSRHPTPLSIKRVFYLIGKTIFIHSLS